MKRKNIFIIGNSINRLNKGNKSWKDIISEWEIKADIEGDQEWKQSSRLPFVYRASRITNKWIDEDISTNDDANNILFSESLSVLCNYLLEYEPDEQQKRIIEALPDCEIMTTNYDYTLEKALKIKHSTKKRINIDLAQYRKEMDMAILGNLNRRIGKIWHIHGEAYKPASIVMDADSYTRELNNLRLHGHNQGTWMYEFLNSDVYIIGLNLNHHEILLMYALQERMKLPKEKRHEVSFYRFVEKKGGKDIDYKDQELLLKSMNVTVIDVNIEDSYSSTWMKLITELRKKISGDSNSIYNDQKILKKRWGAKNIVSSSTATMSDTNLCWMNIPVTKLSTQELSGRYLIFEFLINNIRYAYIYPVDDLMKEFNQKRVKKIMNNPERYSFYVNYSKGILYDSQSSKKKVVVKLQKIQPEDIEKYIFPIQNS